ncbi:hypothetical protein KSS87_014233 [Heliosperma pusillum]|nr:hypothetical protein KSS87_014233 [Heliosperma pusillum]
MFAMRVKIALAEKGITDYECREENIVVSKSPLLLQMNPVHKKIPVLIHNGKPICESLIIVEYIDEVWNHTSPLLPTDPYLKSHAKFWADFVDKKMYPVQKKIWATKEESQDETKKEFIEILKTFEKELGDKCYFGGDNIGFVDIALITYYSFFRTYEYFSGLSLEAECPQLIAWAKRCLLKDSVSSSLADMDKVLEIIIEYRKIKGIA